MRGWIESIIRKYAKLGVLDYCVDCGYFVVGKTDVHFNHLVVRVSEVARNE